jgi:hypothetical protein
MCVWRKQLCTLLAPGEGSSGSIADNQDFKYIIKAYCIRYIWHKTVELTVKIERGAENFRKQKSNWNHDCNKPRHWSEILDAFIKESNQL